MLTSNNSIMCQDNMHMFFNNAHIYQCGKTSRGPTEDDPSIIPSTKGLHGWICPICDAGLSPYITVCPCTYKTGIIT